LADSCDGRESREWGVLRCRRKRWILWIFPFFLTSIFHYCWSFIIASHGHDLYIHSFLYILCGSHECCIMSVHADPLSPRRTANNGTKWYGYAFVIRAYLFIPTSIHYHHFLSVGTDTIYINAILQFSSPTSQRVAITQIDSLTKLINYILSRCK
jgi:hypothetical protein